MATLQFLGGVGEVTGSRYLLEYESDQGAHAILLECGLRQGGPDAERINTESLTALAEKISAVVISHGHLDHAGLLPKLVHDGFGGPIHCAGDTLDLLEIMLADAAFVMAKDIEWKNKWRGKSGKPLLEPPYLAEDVEHTLAQCRPHPYGEPVDLPGGATLVFRDAGHILGSAIVEIVVNSGGRRRHLVFSGDLGNDDSALMNDPEKLPGADAVLMESTYGNRNHRPMDETVEEFAQVLQDAYDAGGNVLIPAFAVGRTQEVLYHLSQLYHAGRLPQQLIFLDSPMAIRVTELYVRKHRSLNKEDITALNKLAQGDPSRYLPGLRATRTVEESMAINRIRSGAIIIAGSGMCNGGRILHHLRYNLAKSATHVVIVGFQAAGTLGRQLVDGARSVKVLGEELPVKAKIHTIGGFSAHAGQAQLLSWAGAFRGRPTFYLVHGEPEAREALQIALAEAGIDAATPDYGERIVL
ncbi:MBL fold metallo-hydrolase [Alkalilimnicola ehrlichii]|uniref:MBL fold metallo-hydrolase n=1 Tax=Alkalilimnicola ehrlichii TaxID=351052 RepID=A0A3E0WGN2_9GAMM|nr:MBL fold metallo-hydrolase [Alkalilimnicola ehrlichii]RFA29399.1 MBL fold metallo-hydrolase [Alkalilimnicola ehrlichii]RFA31918.1 MBL fold metallo-hydrolase [Alkalilimnicola ehrlichii]